MNDLTTKNNPSLDMFEIMEKAYKFAEIIATSDIIPTHYRNKPANVFIAMQTAYRRNLDPMLVMQNTFIISGKLGMNTTFAISLANASGIFVNGIRYKIDGTGENLAVTAYTNYKNTGEEISYTITYKEANAEGWTKNTKYQTLPELMLRYRAATFLIRTHVPEIMNGMHMVEELEDMNATKTIILPTRSHTADLSDRVMKINNAIKETNDKLIEDSVSPLSSSLESLYQYIVNFNIPDEMVTKWCNKAGVISLEGLTDEQIEATIEFIKTKYNEIG